MLHYECPHCGFALLKNSKFCPQCGEVILLPQCISCGSKIKKKSNFCPDCGKQVQQRLCPNCNMETDFSSGYCIECGMKFIVITDEKHSIKPHTKSAFLGYEHPLDRKYLKSLKMIPLFDRVVKVFVTKFYKKWVENDCIGNGIRVSEKQFPEIHNLLIDCMKSLTVENYPTTYIIHDPHWNAFTIGTDDESIIVLHSSIVEELSEDELKTIIAHEMGHIQCNHVLYHTIGNFLVTGASSAFNVLAAPLKLALLRWSRMSEFSADRAALMVVKDIGLIKSTFVKLHLGSNELFERINMDEYLTQFEDIDNVSGKFAEAFKEHPFGVKRINELIKYFDSSDYEQIIHRF